MIKNRFLNNEQLKKVYKYILYNKILEISVIKNFTIKEVQSVIQSIGWTDELKCLHNFLMSSLEL